MTEHLPECWATYPSDPPAWCICDELHACRQRVFAFHPEWTITGACKPDCLACRRLTELITAWQDGCEKGVGAAREAIAEKHLPTPVIECECGWGINCPECGSESNRIVGSVCRVCCDDWGDHGYCGDLHNDDDSPTHHVGGEMWSGPFCPVLAAIDALLGEKT